MGFDYEMIEKDPYLAKNIKSIEKIYSKMVDDKSKKMYQEAINMIATSDYTHLIKIHELNSIKSDKIILQLIQYKKLHEQGKKIIFYGLGERTLNMVKDSEKTHSSIGFSFIPFITDIPITFFCDQNYQNYSGKFLGRPVISPEELKQQYKDEIVVINTKSYFTEIKDELIQAGFKDNNIFLQEYCQCEEYDRIQYFEEFMKKDKESIFVDAGCFNGETTKSFIDWQPNYDKIIAFEPDQFNFSLCRKNLESIRSVEIINAGLSDKTGKCFFSSGESSASHIDKTGRDLIETVKLDDIIGDDKVSFIKMDIEGAELDALIGGGVCIKKNLPSLAICAYHKKYDLIELPKYICELSEHYRFYLRIYSNHWHEWVLYAVADTN